MPKTPLKEKSALDLSFGAAPGDKAVLAHLQTLLKSLPAKKRKKVAERMMEFGRVFGSILDLAFGSLSGKP